MNARVLNAFTEAASKYARDGSYENAKMLISSFATTVDDCEFDRIPLGAAAVDAFDLLENAENGIASVVRALPSEERESARMALHELIVPTVFRAADAIAVFAGAK